ATKLVASSKPRMPNCGRRGADTGDEAGGVVQAAHGKLRTSCSSGDEAGGVVQAADAKLRASCT
ncbi:hypothetical protein PF007_g33100, partial [Phytophthora fragariae]